MRLRTKFALVLLVFAVVLSGSVYGGLELYKQRLVGEAQTEVNETASLTAEQIDASIEQRKDFIGFVASRPKAARFDQSDQFLVELVDNSRFFAAQIIAVNGTIVDFHGDVSQEVRQESIGQNVAGRAYVSRALAGEVYMTEPEYVNATDKYLVIIAAPIFEDREVRGVLAAAIYIDQQTFFDTIGPLETTGQTVVVKDDDTVLYPARTTYPQQITAVATVGSTGWSVTVIQDRSMLVSRLQDLAIAQGLGLFVLLFAVVSYGVWEYRTTLAQTERLLDGFAALARGEFGHSLSLSTAEEWEQISAGFNELATELREREAELQRREQRLEVLNRALRHNLRNHTSVILGYAETIREQSSDERVSESAENLMATAMELIDLGDKARQIETAMDSSSTYGERMPVEVTSIVHAVLNDLQSDYPEIETTSRTPGQAWAYAIPAIEMAIENLVENACRHNSSPNPRVEVTVEETRDDGDPGVEIRVADNGPGIPEHEQRVITEGRETALEHGSGLGLWLAYWTVERSDGGLRFESNDPEGTVVTLELDAVPPDQRPSGDDEGRQGRSEGETGAARPPERSADAPEQSGASQRQRLDSIPYNELRRVAAENDVDVSATPSKEELVDALCVAGAVAGDLGETTRGSASND